jgi:uncharacterized protein (TIGR03435 family)
VGRGIIIALLLFSAVVAGAAQAPAQFEVAAIKPANPKNDFTSSGPDGSDWTATNVSLVHLIEFAFGFMTRDSRVVGIAPWMRDRRFDIRAKGSVPYQSMSRDARTAALQKFLADRFALRTHIEQRPMDVFVVTLARGDRPGSMLVAAPPECTEAFAKERPAPDVCSRPTWPPGCEERAFKLRGSLQSMLGAFRQIGGFEYPLLDRTGLEGLFNMCLQRYTTDPLGNAGDRIPIRTAVEDQLGLKLTRSREALDVIVIDGASPPTLD